MWLCWSTTAAPSRAPRNVEPDASPPDGHPAIRGFPEFRTGDPGPMTTEMQQGRGDLWWIGVVIPFGLATWATFLYLGLRARRAQWLAWAAAYLAMLVGGLGVNQLGNDADPLFGAIAATILMVTWGAGIAHYYVIQTEARARLGGWRSRRELACEQIQRRREAQALAKHNPELALELGIGRPVDQGHDAGGVIDINNANRAQLALLPGIDDELLESIIEGREAAGRFSSVFDLGLVLDLPASVVELWRPCTVFLPPDGSGLEFPSVDPSGADLLGDRQRT
jgi:Helix-hairpin-helix motif